MASRKSGRVGKVLDVFVAKPFQLSKRESAGRIVLIAENTDIIEPAIEWTHQAPVAVGIADGDGGSVGDSAALVQRAGFEQSDAVGASAFIETNVVTGSGSVVGDSKEDPRTRIGIMNPGAGSP